MKNFNAVIRTLLARIETVRNRSDWPPSATAVSTPVDSLYRVAPTRWGVAGPRAPEGTVASQARKGNVAAPPRQPGETDRPHRFRLELNVFSLPVPKGLPAT